MNSENIRIPNFSVSLMRIFATSLTMLTVVRGTVVSFAFSS
jgi:hypothetical protein